MIDLTSDDDTTLFEDNHNFEAPVMYTGSKSKSDIKVDSIAIKHVIQQHQAWAIRSNDDKDVQRIHIWRSHVLSDALRQFLKESFDVTEMLQVRFVGEEAVDTGGPQGEFFHLLLCEMLTSSLFAGYPDHVILSHKVEAVATEKYHLIGKMIATCIVQGGEAPACFSKAVADFLILMKFAVPCV